MDSPIGELVERIRPYDVADLLAAVGGLQLIPENAERTVRLTALAQAAISLKHEPGKPRIGRRRLDQICSTPPLSDGPIAAAEDPAGNPFTEAFAFVGGSYIVFPGIVEEATYVLEHLVRAILLDLRPFSASAFMQEAFHLIQAGLVLSNEMAQRAGLSRGLAPRTVAGGRVIVPHAGRLEELKKAVTFEKGELAGLLESHGVHPGAIDPLALDCGAFNIDRFQIAGETLSRQPLVHAGNTIIVAEPGSLLPALRHRLVRLALEHGVHGELADRFGRAVWRDVLRSLKFLGHDPVDFELPDAPELTCFHEGLFVLDRDKALYAALVTDDLHGYGDEVFGGWQPQSLAEKLEKRSQLVEEGIFTAPSTPNEMMVLFLIETMGRWHVTGFGSPPPPMESPRLILSACDLRTIAELEGGNPLLLWKYAVASERARDRMEVRPLSQLDEFHLYRTRGYSYYMSDERLPNLLVIGPGGDGELRRKAQRQRDWHGVASFESGYIAEVTCLHDDAAVPLYVAPAHFGRVVSLLVEGVGLPVWIVADRDQSQKHPQFAGIQRRLCEMIGYWLWQFAPDISSLVGQFGGQHPVLTIRVVLLEEDRWLAEESKAVMPPSAIEPLSVAVDTATASITLNIGTAVVGMLTGSDNAGERWLMTNVLAGICQLANAINPGSGDGLANRKDDVLETHAPLGVKKALIILDPRADPRLDDHDLPRFRRLQSADTNHVLDELGLFLTDSLGLKVGPIPDARRKDILGQVVEFLYQKLQSLVSTIRGDELLDFLVAQHERITQHIAERRLTIPTRTACYGGVFDILEQLREELPRSSALALSSRFVIEYAAARPPNGPRPMSLSLYDRLLGLAHQLIDWAYLSDLIHYNIADVKLRIVPSGRLVAERDPLVRAQQSYVQAYAAQEVSLAAASFESHWWEAKVSQGQDSQDPRLVALEHATRREFGKSLSEMTVLYADIMNIGYEQDGPLKSLPLEELADRLVESLGWSRDDVSSALEVISLKPRPDFLEPGDPFRLEDVYPWRFNRGLSYIRRPLLCEERAGRSSAIWGNRHMAEAAAYLGDLCIGGRLRARSPEMKRYISRALNEAGDAFNNSVASVMEACGHIRVRRKVKKVAGEPVGGRATPMGDIDVMAGNPRRRKLLLIECKDLALARTPHELASELGSLFWGQKGKPSLIARHQKRADWVKAKTDRVLRLLGLESKGRWEVEAIVVVDQESFSSRIYQSPMPVMSLREFREEFLPRWAN